MPAYNASPFSTRAPLILTGQEAYSWGTYAESVPTLKFLIKNVAITTNVATITVQLWEGVVPVVGQLISTQGLVNIPNVTNIAITAVTGFTTGDKSNGTIAYALTNANVVSIADSGLALVPNMPVFEALPAPGTSGKAFVMSAISGDASGSMSWATGFSLNGGTISAVDIGLQGAINDNDAEYTTVDHSTVTTGESRNFTPVKQMNFWRINVKTYSVTGSPKLWSKIIV